MNRERLSNYRAALSSDLDLDGAELAFAASTDATVGIEEEFAILDPETHELVPRFEELRDEAQDDALLSESIAGELISSEIEIRSGPGEDVHDAIRRQREVRGRLFAHATAQGAALASTGTHPWAGLPRAAEHRHRALPPRRRRAAVRRAPEQHLLAARPRRRPRPQPRRPDLRPPAARAARPARRERELPVRRRARQRAALAAHPGLHPLVPALRRPRRVRQLGGLPRVPRDARRDRVDRRVHAGLVVGAPAPRVRHRRSEDLRRPGHRGRIRGAHEAHRRLRAAGRPRRRRRRPVP